MGGSKPYVSSSRPRFPFGGFEVKLLGIRLPYLLHSAVGWSVGLPPVAWLDPRCCVHLLPGLLDLWSFALAFLGAFTSFCPSRQTLCSHQSISSCFLPTFEWARVLLVKTETLSLISLCLVALGLASVLLWPLQPLRLSCLLTFLLLGLDLVGISLKPLLSWFRPCLTQRRQLQQSPPSQHPEPLRLAPRLNVPSKCALRRFLLIQVACVVLLFQVWIGSEELGLPASVREARVGSPNRTPSIDLRPRFYAVLRAEGLEVPTIFRSSGGYWRCIGGALETSSSISHSFPSEQEAKIYLRAAGVTDFVFAP